VLAILGLDSINPLIELRHFPNLERRGRQVRLFVVALSEVHEVDTHRVVLLARAEPLPTVELNNSIVVAMRDGPLAALS
jgi:hypothetical protein